MLLAIGFRIKVFYGSLLGLSIAICLQLALINSFGVVGIMYVKIFFNIMCNIVSIIFYDIRDEKGILNGFIKFLPILLLIPLSLYLCVDLNIVLRISIPIIILIISFMFLRIF